MKQKISITIDEKTVFDILDSIKSGKFRNKSHVVEYAVKKLLEDNNESIGEAPSCIRERSHARVQLNDRRSEPSTNYCERSEHIENI